MIRLLQSYSAKDAQKLGSEVQSNEKPYNNKLNSIKEIAFQGDNSVNILQTKTVDQLEYEEQKINDVFVPNIPDLSQEATLTLKKSGDILDLSFDPTKTHNDIEEYTIFSAALYTAIKKAIKMNIPEINMDPNDKFAKQAGFKQKSAQGDSKLAITQESYNKILKKISQLFRRNFKEFDEIYQTSKRFEPKSISLSGLNSDSLTIGPNGDVKLGLENDSMKDLKVDLFKQDGKTFIKNVGSNNNVKILGNTTYVQEKQPIKSGDTIKLGNEYYLFRTDSESYELRFLTRDDKGHFEKLFPDGVGHVDFQQGEIGDCYFIASLKSLSNNPNRADLLAKMIETTPEGDYKVTFPGFPKQSFEVKNSELSDGCSVTTDNPGVKV
ncbi:MAG TPA: hypothetical protein DDX14_04370, partial [Cyanobacteria bacterium UBA9579]|nr:hypothetical protein [Cyanobacteria bacterium UBA9579]